MQYLRKLLKSRKVVIAVSVTAIFLCVTSLVFSTLHRQREADTKAIESFQNTVVALNGVVTNYLTGEQDNCDAWALYINKHSMTMEEALEMIEDSNTNSRVSGQIIDMQTYSGKATRLEADQEDSEGERFESVYYDTDESDQYESLLTVIQNTIEDDDPFHVTSFYNNPVNGEKVISFVSSVTIYDESNQPQTMALLRVLPSDLLEEVWVFPNIYQGASIELIDREGRYISYTKLTGSDNFYSYLSSYNNLSETQIDDLREKVNGKESSYAFYNTADGEKTLFVSSEVESVTEDWVLIAYIPASMLEKMQFNFVPVIILILTFVVLFWVILTYLLDINRQLKTSMEETRRANAAKTDFLATMSHDIRTPMNAIIGMTAIAEKNISDKSHVEDCLKKINLSSNHLLTLINDILDISKIESGQYAINPTVFSLCDLMDNLFNIVRENIKGKEQKLQIHTHGINHEYLFADKLRLSQIYINILTNAVKYTNQGGRITVDLYQEPSPVLEHGVRLIYRVEDTGIGMSKEYMGKMYEAFSRESDGRTDVIQGTGLGLAITRQLVELMNGTIEAQSEVGEGTVFTVTLDFPTADNITENIMLPDITMIVIDDDKALLESAGDTLKQIGIHADLADSGRKGVEMIRYRHRISSDYQVVILDWKMPDMDGLEVTRIIRAEIGYDIPIIIVSAYDYTEIEKEALAAGVSGFISKPLFKSSICRTLNDLLKLHEDAAPHMMEKYDISGMNILVAEDNDMNYEIAATLLEDEGAHCTRAENGRICVDLLEQNPDHAFDLVLMDMQMPVLKGLEATKLIRESKRKAVRLTPVIAMTADAFAENIAECLAGGMDGHIAKPIDMKLVLAEIERVMKQRELLN